MSQTDTLTLPHEIYSALLEVAKIDGITPVEWIAARLPKEASGHRTQIIQAEIEAANAKLRATIVSPGYSTNSDNDSIDADLAREYGDDHIALYRERKSK